ncbi:MAG: alanine--tRNA ligase [Candidatus Colwellbacteria bacterium]|nr:alanine--tRNA ligase [Candidatus Colwellbacteria bacterium]
MSSEETRDKFFEFFEKRGHKRVPSSSLIPTDPSVLITSAGMQQFKKYYTGEADALKDFGSLNTATIQKIFRTSDIEEVGDETHLTFFEMLGNFSFGGYFKKEAIEYAHEFITKSLGLKIDYVSVFEGDSVVEADKESAAIWKSIDSAIEVRKFGREDNFWGPTGSEGPCGPTSEVYVKGTEVWNLVFNEFYCHKDGHLEKLEVPGVDTGMGMERILMVLGNFTDVFETDVLKPIVDKIEELKPRLDKKVLRILADHIRASMFLISDGIRPSNKEAGYILRRLLRRIIAYQIKCDIHPDLFSETVSISIKKFGHIYENLKNESEILSVWQGERGKFELAVGRGIKELSSYKKITGGDAFNIYQSYGLPLELILMLAPPEAVQDLKQEDFDREHEKHIEVSQFGAEKKFGGHGLLLDTGELKAKDEEELEKVTKLHTATHLLQAALRKVLGDEVRQQGSDITSERTRFDFSFVRKLEADEIGEVEKLVNDAIKRDLPVRFLEMPFEEARVTGALYSSREKYPAQVKVYYAGRSLEDAFSKEFCGGPHVAHTGQIGKFKILKEEATSAGIRRIRAGIL